MALYIGCIVVVATAALWLLLTGRIGRRQASAISGIAGLASGFLAVQGLNYSLSGAIAATSALAVVLGAADYRRGGSISAIQSALVSLTLAEAGVWIGFRVYMSHRIVFIVMILFVALLFGMQKLIETRSPGAAKAAKRPTNGAGAIVLLSLIVVIGGALLANTDRAAAGRIGKSDTQTALYDEDNGLQTARVQVNGAGFNPRNIDFKPNVMIKLVFEVTDVAPKNMHFVSEALNLDMELQRGDNAILVKNPKPGVYSFYVGDPNQSGTFTVLSSDL